MAFNQEERELIYFSLGSPEVLPYFAEPNDNGMNKMKIFAPNLYSKPGENFILGEYTFDNLSK